MHNFQQYLVDTWAMARGIVPRTYRSLTTCCTNPKTKSNTNTNTNTNTAGCTTNRL